jgi:hypothetical protein
LGDLRCPSGGKFSVYRLAPIPQDWAFTRKAVRVRMSWTAWDRVPQRIGRSLRYLWVDFFCQVAFAAIWH